MCSIHFSFLGSSPKVFIKFLCSSSSWSVKQHSGELSTGKKLQKIKVGVPEFAVIFFHSFLEKFLKYVNKKF